MTDFGPYQHATPAAGAGVVVRGGCVRFDTGDAPRLHVNSAHASVGIVPSSLSIVSGMLHVDLDASLPVVSVGAFADETLTARGITAGVSGGVNSLNVRFALDGFGPLDLGVPAHYDKLRGSTSNVWLLVASLKLEG